MIEVRHRQRPAAPLPTPMGLPVVGGPRRPPKLPKECSFPTGQFHTTPGHPIKQWPWRTGSNIIGLIYPEYTLVKGVTVLVAVHIYRLTEKEWRYAGKVPDKETARDKLEDMHQASTKVPSLQPVAPRPRTRRN